MLYDSRTVKKYHLADGCPGKICAQDPNNEPVSIADEVPFEIPDSWEWVRLGNIGDWGSGATPSRTKPEYYDGNPVPISK